MSLDDIPAFIRENYEIHEWRHASSVLLKDFHSEWENIMEVLSGFRLHRNFIEEAGGNKSKVSKALDGHFSRLGWKETKFNTKILVEELEVIGRNKTKSISVFSLQSPTHQVDEYKNHVAVEVEWNNKDPFFDRDLNNFRLLFDLRVISVGIIITRTDELQGIFDELGRGDSAGENTTHMRKLLPRLEGGSGGGCPVLVFGIKRNLYVED